ncbi:MAG: AAA family ATPase [bacterium]|nr:AAA family ATPase [bacterium]
MTKAKVAEPRPLWGIPSMRIPILYLLGESGTGKTTAAYSIAPVPAGQTHPARVLHIDFEKSGIDHERRFHVQREDLSGDALAFGKMVEGLEKVKEGEYDVIILDPISDFDYDKVYDYLLSAKAIKPKNPDANIARRLASADIHSWLKNFFSRISTKCQTLVLISHLKREFDKASKQNTDRFVARGFDFKEISTMTVRLFAPGHIDPNGRKPNAQGYEGQYWASLVGGKNRLVATAFDEDGEARTVKALPDVMRLVDGLSLPAYMRRVFKNPTFDQGEQLTFDPMADTLTDSDKDSRELALLNARHESDVLRLKTKLIEDLTGKKNGGTKWYPDVYAVGEAITALQLAGDANDPAKIYPDVYNALLKYAKERDAKVHAEAELANLSVTQIMEGKAD